MSVFAHQEDGYGWRPRHPITCILDLMGICMALAAWTYRPELTASLLPAAIAAQYGISCVYHWLPYNKIRQAIDHIMIAVLISATYMHYWMGALPPDEASWRALLLGAATLVVLVLRVTLPEYRKLRGILYLVLGLGGLGLSLLTPAMLPLAAWIGFLSGIGLYFIQFLIFSLQKPDPLPELVGFREVQHLILLAASGLHLTVAAIYL